MSNVVTTSSVEPARRLSYWIDLICDTYVQLECDAPRGVDRVEGEIVANRLSTLALSQVTASAQVVRRTPAKIRQASEDWFLVSLQTRGRGVISQDGRDAVLGPGDFALYDSTRPYTLTFDDDFQQLVLMMPGPSLREVLPDTHRLTARRVGGDRGAGHLMISMIGTLAQDIGTLTPASAEAVADSVSRILVAGLASLPDAPSPVTSSLTSYHRERIKALVRSRYRDPGFGVAEIAATLKLSASSVHRAWAGEVMSITDWIWSLRLESARADLADPQLASHSISRIAFACGFNDAAHFSRTFRARFGHAPKDARQPAGG